MGWNIYRDHPRNHISLMISTVAHMHDNAMIEGKRRDVGFWHEAAVFECPLLCRF
jgi:hypothetical protein